MNKIYKLFLILIAALTVSCSKDDPSVTPVRDRAVQYAKDLDSIDKYLDTHFMVVDANYNVTFDSIRTTGPQVSIRQQTDFPLEFKMVADTVNDINYKLYYIKLREGENEIPSRVDSVFTTYRGTLITETQFDAAQNPVWAKLDEVVKGWPEVFTSFKTGFYDVTTPEGDPASYNGYGAGIMFIPSGLGYFNTSQTGIPGYSPLIFSFKLYALRYRDHDSDGVLSKDEVLAAGDDPLGYDSDGDGVPNYYDIDDDGDHVLTKNEVHKDTNGVIIFQDCDGDGIPNYLDADSNGATCN